MRKDRDDEWNWSKDTVRYFIGRIIERDQDREGEEDSEFNDGRHMGLFEAIDMMRNDLESRGYDFEKFMKGEE